MKSSVWDEDTSEVNSGYTQERIDEKDISKGWMM
jgi:hypothetical protein